MLEQATVTALRYKVRCKKIWVSGADRYRNPDQEVPANFDTLRAPSTQRLIDTLLRPADKRRIGIFFIDCFGPIALVIATAFVAFSLDSAKALWETNRDVPSSNAQ